jgi:hypothetical protein
MSWDWFSFIVGAIAGVAVMWVVTLTVLWDDDRRGDRAGAPR